MHMFSHPLSKLTLVAFVALALGVFIKATAPVKADDGQHPHSQHDTLHMTHISTQSEAEALKPGDSIAMACSMCKHIMVHHVTKDRSHVKLMTIGQKHKCVCGGTVTVVGTGKGQGKNELVNHVCSTCGDDAMFVCATKPDHRQKHQHND